MLYYNFGGCEGFKSLFGLQKHDNGTKSRKNKILLSFLKNKEPLHKARVNDDYSLLWITSMAALKKVLMDRIQDHSSELPYRISIINYTFGSSKYSTDENHGLCVDGDSKCVRYTNQDSGKAYKMKAGKLLRSIIMDAGLDSIIGETAMGYLCEELARDWETYTMGAMPKSKLTVSKEFCKIYSSASCEGDFGSCMVNKDQHSFYENAVEASAAYLTNEDGKIIARCIIYDKVYDEGDNEWRLAERQYSSGGSDVLKRCLIDKLIKDNRIDGYKVVGASCHESTSFVDIQGNSLSDKKFRISCDLDTDDTLSYQDSFKWYDHCRNVAYNHDTERWDYELDITERSLDDAEEDEYPEYDEYHNYRCAETTYVHYHGREIECDSDNLYDFELVGDEWYHKDDISKCPYCGEWFVTEEGTKSELTGELYCDGSCKINGEEDWKDEHWFYSDYDVEYYEHEEDITRYYAWNDAFGFYAEKTISINSYQQLLLDGDLIQYDGKAYDKINPETLRPYDHATA